MPKTGTSRPMQTEKKLQGSKTEKKPTSNTATKALNDIRKKYIDESSKAITKALKNIIPMANKNDPALFKKIKSLYLNPNAENRNLINLLDSKKYGALIKAVKDDPVLLSGLTFDRKAIDKIISKLK